jgi:hypothetical protein
VRGGDWESGGNSKRASSAGEEIASAEAAGEKKMAAVETFGVFIGRKRERRVGGRRIKHGGFHRRKRGRAASAGEEATMVAADENFGDSAS